METNLELLVATTEFHSSLNKDTMVVPPKILKVIMVIMEIRIKFPRAFMKTPINLLKATMGSSLRTLKTMMEIQLSLDKVLLVPINSSANLECSQWKTLEVKPIRVVPGNIPLNRVAF